MKNELEVNKQDTSISSDNKSIRLEQVGPLVAGLLLIIYGLYSLVYDTSDVHPIMAIGLVILGVACILRCLLTDEKYDSAVKMVGGVVAVLARLCLFVIAVLARLCLFVIFAAILFFVFPSIVALPTNTLLALIFLYFIYTRR